MNAIVHPAVRVYVEKRRREKSRVENENFWCWRQRF